MEKKECSSQPQTLTNLLKEENGWQGSLFEEIYFGYFSEKLI